MQIWVLAHTSTHAYTDSSVSTSRFFRLYNFIIFFGQSVSCNVSVNFSQFSTFIIALVVRMCKR